MLETSVPGIFACGDARHDSVKRVASAVGENAPQEFRSHDDVGIPAGGKLFKHQFGLVEDFLFHQGLADAESAS